MILSYPSVKVLMLKHVAYDSTRGQKTNRRGRRKENKGAFLLEFITSIKALQPLSKELADKLDINVGSTDPILTADVTHDCGTAISDPKFSSIVIPCNERWS